MTFGNPVVTRLSKITSTFYNTEWFCFRILMSLVSNRNRGLSSPNCHFYTKLKGDLVNSINYFLGLNQHNYADIGSNLLDLVFSNFADLSVDHVEYGLVQPDHFNPQCQFDFLNCNISYKRFSPGDYAVLYNALSNYDWSSLYNETAVDAIVDMFKRCCNSSHRFSCSFSLY